MKKLFVASALFLAIFGRAQVQYHLTDLGSLGGEVQHGISSDVGGLNAMGQLVGEAYTSGGVYHAYLYSNGTMIDMGIPNSGFPETGFDAITDSGKIVGTAFNPGHNYHAFSYTSGVWQDLGDLNGGNSYSQAYGINPAGQIIGWTYVGTDQFGGDGQRAFLYSNGVMQDLGTLGGNYSIAQGISASGQIVGNASTAGNLTHAFLDVAGVMQDLGTLGGDNSQAYAINDSGQIVGGAEIPGAQYGFPLHAFLYQNGSMQDLGFLGGDPSQSVAYATAINTPGQIVGISSTAAGTDDGFLYENGAMYDVNSLLDSSGSGYLVTTCQRINDDGLIAGLATVPGQTYSHAVLLTPVAQYHILPSSLTPVVGAQNSGSLYSVQFNDPWYLTVQPGTTSQLAQAPVQMQFSGTASVRTPTTFQFTFAGHVNSINLSESVQLLNYNTGAYETFSSTGAHVGSDSTVTVTATGDLRRYVNQSTGAVSAKVNFSRAGFTSVLRWTASLGVANWIIQ